MKVTITEIVGKTIKFIEDGVKEIQEAQLADYVLDFVKNGEAEMTITDGVVTFCTMLSDIQKKPEAKKTGAKKLESTGEFNENEIVDIKGKKHVIYEGLLRVAHKKGLKKFEIIDKFVSQDMKIAWVQVRAYCEKDKKEIFFDGIGSSTPDNTGTMTEHHPVEMAHTRAKGRALRDFLNIGQAMAEEIKQ